MIYKGYNYKKLADTNLIDTLDRLPTNESEMSTLMDRVAEAAAPSGYAGRTVYWDPSAPAGGEGTMAKPYNNLSDANAASSEWGTVVALGGGDLTSLPLLMNRIYDFNNHFYTITGHATVTGTGTLLVSNLLAFATTDATFITIGAGQRIQMTQAQLFTTGDHTVFSISGASSELEIANGRVENNGDAIVFELGSGSPNVVLSSVISRTGDEVTINMSSGSVSIDNGSSISNSSALTPTAIIDGTSRMVISSNSSIGNDAAGKAVALMGANSSFRMSPGAVIFCNSGDIFVKDSAGSQMVLAPIGPGVVLGTVASGGIGVAAGVPMVYVPGDPNGAVLGSTGQIVQVLGGSAYVCLNNTTWQAL